MLVTALVRQQIELPGCGEQGSLRFRIEFESGGVADGEAKRRDDSTLTLPGINLPGYHQLSIGGRQLTLAVAPASCYSIADAVGQPSPREWALAVAALWLAPAAASRRARRGQRRHRRLHRAGGAGAARWRRKGATAHRHQPRPCHVQRRSGTLQPLWAVEPAVSQRSAHRSGRSLRAAGRGAGGVGAGLERRAGAAGAARADRLAGGRARPNWRSCADCSRISPAMWAAACKTTSSSFAAPAGARWKTMRDSRRCMPGICRTTAARCGWQAWPEGFRHPEGPAVEAFAATPCR